jgi:hypothetical protein
MIREIRAEMESRSLATLSRPFPLLYGSGASSTEDYPAFVRAASAIRRWQGRRVIIQDDVNVLALAEPARAEAAGAREPGPAAEGALEPLLLPRGEGGLRSFDASRGNKRSKLDLEAALVLPDGRLVAFGSGSLPQRERLVVVEPGSAPVLRDARELYRGLRQRTEFAGSELNLEGAIVRSGAIELFQRGNGAASGELGPANAIGRLALDDFLSWLDRAGPPPSLQHVLRVDLGRAHGVPLGFTDAALGSDGTVLFLACAEASPDAVADGEVVAMRLGLMHGDRARLVEIVDALGQPCRIKLEGIEARDDAVHRFDVVADVDDPNAAALGATLELVHG